MKWEVLSPCSKRQHFYGILFVILVTQLQQRNNRTLEGLDREAEMVKRKQNLPYVNKGT